MRIYDNGIYRDMTADEIAIFKRESAVAPAPTAEERLAVLESRMEQAEIDRAVLTRLLTGE